jgi:hypothetical protein
LNFNSWRCLVLVGIKSFATAEHATTLVGRKTLVILISYKGINVISYKRINVMPHWLDGQQDKVRRGTHRIVLPKQTIFLILNSYTTPTSCATKKMTL